MNTVNKNWCLFIDFVSKMDVKILLEVFVFRTLSISGASFNILKEHFRRCWSIIRGNLDACNDISDLVDDIWTFTAGFAVRN